MDEMPKEIFAGINIAGNKWHELEGELTRAGIAPLCSDKYTLTSILESERAEWAKREKELVGALEDVALGKLQGPDDFETYAKRVAQAALQSADKKENW